MFIFFHPPPVLAILAGLAGCPVPAPVVAGVELKVEKPVYIQTYSSAQLGRMKKKQTVIYKGREVSGILGFTQGDVSYRYTSDYNVQKSGGVACLGMTEVKLTVTYSPKIYISTDHDFLGCSVKHVMKHEQQHYDADTTILTTHLAALKQALVAGANKIGARGPVIEAAIETVEGDMRLAVIEAMQPIVKKIRRLRLKAHSGFDSEESYARDTKACANPL